MIYNNNGKHLMIIGFNASTITQEITYMFEEGIMRGDAPGLNFDVITPDEFFKIGQKEVFQYLVMFNKDQKVRKDVIDTINCEGLNCVSAVHHTAWMPANAYIGKGTVIGPFASLYQHTKLGDHVVLEAYSMVGHHSEVGDNVHIRPNVMISGNVTIGDNCMINSRSTVLEGYSICDGVALGAMTCVRKHITESGIYLGTSAKRVGEFADAT